MWSAEVCITPAGEQEQEALVQAYDTLHRLLCAWRNHGQVCGREWPIWTAGNTLRTVVLVPRDDALEVAHDNNWAEAARSDLHASGAELTWAPLGVEPSSLDPCSCSERTAFILYTDYLTLESPLRCGECFRPVPLFTVAATDPNGEHLPVIHWRSDYQACDTLQMGTAVGERFGERQLADLNSPLNRCGRQVAKALAQQSGLPVYYYLHKTRGQNEKVERTRTCPQCHGDWLLDTKLHGRFDFRCDTCHLLGNVACSLRSYRFSESL